jgi:hypothetical protein
MPSFRRIVLVCTLIGVAALAPAVDAASPSTPIHITKDCSAYTGENPSLCVIAASDMAAIPVGTKIWYQGPVLTNVYFLSSNILLEAPTGATSTGYCIFDAHATDATGICTFWSGTGALTGFTSVVDVTIDASHLWHWDGVYYFAEVAQPSVNARPMSPRPL